jgi:hypothetical protein
MLQTCLPTCILASSTSSLNHHLCNHYSLGNGVSKIQQIQKSKTNQKPTNQTETEKG